MRDEMKLKRGVGVFVEAWEAEQSQAQTPQSRPVPAANEQWYKWMVLTPLGERVKRGHAEA